MARIVANVGELDGWLYCPRCRSDLLGDARHLTCAQCGFFTYATPKPTASAVCLEDDRVLLARRAIEPYRGFWALPGGFVEEDEHPLDTLRREVAEEIGVEVTPRAFIGSWLDKYAAKGDPRSTLNLYWAARVVAGEPRVSDEVSEVLWFALDELPSEDEIAFRNVPQVLAAVVLDRDRYRM